MLVNLKRPYDKSWSKRRTDYFAFFTARLDDFLFEKEEDVVIYVAGVKRTLTPVFKLCKNLIHVPFYVDKAQEVGSYMWTIRIDKSMLEPGFYDVEIEADQGDGTKLQGYCTFGYDIVHQNRQPNRPADFEQFWEQSLERLEGVALDPKFGEVTVYRGKQVDDYNVAQASIPCNYDPKGCLYDEVESYEVSFNSVDGLRIHGWLAKPVVKTESADNQTAAQKFPAMLVLPGAGYADRSRPLEHARHGYIALDIQVHGQELEKEQYEQTQVSIDYEDPAFRQKHYYNSIYLHCVQAINYLCSREDVDQKRIVTAGGSQGGRLSLTTAALDKRVTAVVAGIVHYADIPYLQWAREVNERGENGTEKPFAYTNSERMKGAAYYDVLNFAQDIQCPVMINGGLIDTISPPGGIAALYQYIGSREKHLKYMANMAHDWSYQFDIEAWKWLGKVFAE